MRFVRAIGFGLILIVVSVAALALGQAVREVRTPPTGNALAGQATASPSPTLVAAKRLRSFNLPLGYAVGSAARVAPDGRSLVVHTSGKRLAMFEIPPNDGPLVLRGTTIPAGGEWLPDGSGYVIGVYLTPPPSPRNADGAVSTMKQQQFSVFERDGSITAIGSGWMQSRPSPDSRWLPVIDDCCPATIRVLARDGSASRLLSRRQNAQSLLGWDPRGRLLFNESGRLFAVDLAGAVEEIVAPVLPTSAERTYSYVGRSPDATTVVLQVSAAGSQPLVFALSRTGTVSITAYPYSDNWVGPHEMLGATKTKFVAIDTSTGAERDLATKANPFGDAFVGTSSPYLLWRESMTGPLHLLDARTGADRVIDVPWTSSGSQRLDGGRFFLASDTGLAILDPAAWFSPAAPAAP